MINNYNKANITSHLGINRSLALTQQREILWQLP